MLVMELMGDSLRETLSRVDIGREFVWCAAPYLQSGKCFGQSTLHEMLWQTEFN